MKEGHITKTEELLNEDLELEDTTLSMFTETDSDESTEPSTTKPQLYKKGEEWKGNKSGRPKGTKNLKTLFKEAFESIAVANNLEEPERDLIVTLLSKAQKGDMKAMRMFMEYRFGKPTQSLELKADITTNNDQISAMEEMLAKVIMAKQESEE